MEKKFTPGDTFLQELSDLRTAELKLRQSILRTISKLRKSGFEYEGSNYKVNSSGFFILIEGWVECRPSWIKIDTLASIADEMKG